VQASVVFGVSILVATLLAYVLFGGFWLQRKLRRLGASRDAASSLSACLDKFPEFNRQQVESAYRAVQALLLIPNVPLLPDDSLLGTLGVDQGELEDTLQELNGAGPAETVEELLRTMLRRREHAT